jgi:hypothetical protein
MKPKAREPLNNCEGTFDTLNRLETLGYCSLTELASLHRLCLQSIPDLNDAQDAIVNHFITGECAKTNGILCGSVSWIAMSHPTERVSPDDLPVLILDGMLKTATKKVIHRALHLIDLPHSPTDSISVHCKLLRKHIARLHADRCPTQEHA